MCRNKFLRGLIFFSRHCICHHGTSFHIYVLLLPPDWQSWFQSLQTQKAMHVRSNWQKFKREGEKNPLMERTMTSSLPLKKSNYYNKNYFWQYLSCFRSCSISALCSVTVFRKCWLVCHKKKKIETFSVRTFKTLCQTNYRVCNWKKWTHDND